MEEWRDVPGYEGIYLVNNTGIIKGTGKVPNYKRIPHKNRISDAGYERASFYKSDKERWFPQVSRAVALAFILNSHNKPLVDHINRIKTDNRVENLRWATHAENMVNRFMPPNPSKGIRKTLKGYQAYGYANNRYIGFGTFKTEEEARTRVKLHRQKEYGEFDKR